MAFVNLNDDVLTLIISHLYATPPPPPTSLTWGPPVLGQRAQRTTYALVNKRWQLLAEAHTFASIALKSADLPTFTTTFASSRRSESLRRLSFTVSLPTHGDSRASFARNLVAFRTAVRLLFGSLSLWSGRQQGRRLELHLNAVWDIEYQDNEPVDLYFDVTKSSPSRRYLTLLDDGGQQLLLPLVERITSITTSSTAGRAFHPTALCTLAAAMPRLTCFSLSYLDPVPARTALRRELRCALASGLLSLSPLAALSRLTVIREPMSSIHNHGFAVGTLEDSEGVDAFSAAVDTILAGGRHGLITNLHLEDTLLSAQLFLGHHGPWPTLRRLRLRSAEILAPSGVWYYTGDAAAVEPGVESAEKQLGSDVYSQLRCIRGRHTYSSFGLVDFVLDSNHLIAMAIVIGGISRFHDVPGPNAVDIASLTTPIVFDVLAETAVSVDRAACGLDKAQHVSFDAC